MDQSAVTAMANPGPSSRDGDRSTQSQGSNKKGAHNGVEVELANRTDDSGREVAGPGNEAGESVVTYKTYKRRWFGLAQLLLLNIVVSWDVSCTPSRAHHPVCTSEMASVIARHIFDDMQRERASLR
jgi:hypothetical protein